jgi:hypothetical protein
VTDDQTEPAEQPDVACRITAEPGVTAVGHPRSPSRANKTRLRSARGVRFFSVVRTP